MTNKSNSVNIDSADRATLIRLLRPFLEKDMDRSPRVASWGRPEVREARLAHHAVRANGQEYRSVRAAFVALGLPIAKHIPFRKSLKAHGRAVFDGGDRKVKFTLVK